MKTHKMPEEPGPYVKLLIPGATPSIFFRGGSFSEWTNGEEEYDWPELLQEYDEVMELEVPTEAIKFFRDSKMDVYQVYSRNSEPVVKTHLTSLIEFGEAFK